MRRIHQFGITFVVFLAVWISLLHQSGALKALQISKSEKRKKSVLLFNFSFYDTTTSSLHAFLWCLPLICVVIFGVYSLLYIVHSVIYFPTCPKAAETLQKDMKRTQKELVKLGVFTSKQMKEMNKSQ